MSNAFTNAWSWSLRRSPLMALWRAARGMIRPNLEAFALLDQASLPKPIAATIWSTITRTKLWRDEREQIARELIAHAQDALESGRSPEQVVESFGDPRRVARLLRRSMKRKRPFVWQAYRYSRRAVGVVVLVLVVGYGWLAVQFYTDEPKIMVDYGTVLQARNDGYRDDQKSWPILAECGLKWSQINYTLSNEQAARVMGLAPEEQVTGMSIFPFVPVDHPDYESIARAVRDFSPEIAQLREAASRPIIGIPVGYETITVEWESRQWVKDIVPASPADYRDKSIIQVLLPNLGSTRGLSQVLMFDAKLALAAGDARRVCDDYIAAMHLARQCNNEPFLISRLIGIAIHHLCMNEIQWMMREYPEALTHDDLTRLAHTHAQLTAQGGMGLETERYSFIDYIQRIYSDDGDGNGHLTAEGMEWMRQFYSPPKDMGVSAVSDVIDSSDSLRSMTMPLSLLASNDRATELAIHSEAIDRMQTAIERGPQWVSLAISIDQEIETEHSYSQKSPLRYSLVSMMLPALGQSVNRYYQHRQHEKAFSLMLSIESYRLTTGELPDTLTELEPRFLPAVPADLMDPGQPIKYLRSGDEYLIYSVGSDGDDDGGVAPEPSKDQYSRNEQRFSERFVQASSPMTGEPLFEPSGKPVLTDPQGPDGDWILIDTRPQPEPTTEPADEA